MNRSQEPIEVGARLDDLRRRLYRADATDRDLQRYIEERESALPLEPSPPPPPGRSSRPSFRGIALGAAAVLVLALGATVVVGARAGSQAAEPIPTPRGTTVQQNVGDGPVLTVNGEVEGPSPVAVTIDGTAAVGKRFQGYGSVVVFLDPPMGSDAGGRALVGVTSTLPEGVAWRALLDFATGDGTTSPLVIAHGIAEDRSGAHAPTTFDYPTKQPTRIAIAAPAGVGWTLVVGVVHPIASGRSALH